MFSKLLNKSTTSISRRSFSAKVTNSQLTEKITRIDYYQTQETTFANRSSFDGPIKACILDYSGTLVDAHVLGPASVVYEVFAKHGVSITMQEARIPMGLRKDIHIQSILDMPDVRQRWIDAKGEEPNQNTLNMLVDDFVPMQLECLPKYTQLLPGVKDVALKLRTDYSMKIGVTTGFTKDMVDIVLKDTKKQGFEPDSSVAGDQVPGLSYELGSRPKPFMLYQNLINMGIWPIESVVKVDDTNSGIGEGLNAGCWTVGVYGWSNYTNIDSMEQWNNMSETEQNERRLQAKNQLLQSGAHYVAESIVDLPIIVDDINKRLKNGEGPMSNQTQNTNLKM